jgi:(2Fe-2S) ferredoxin
MIVERVSHPVESNAGPLDTMRIGGFPLLAPFERHVFVCQNVRPEGAPRPSCTSDGKSELLPQLQQFVKAAGLGGKVRINKAGCLDQCEHGPTVVVYPEAVWYGHVQPADAEEIVAEHLVGGRPVERLRLDDACVNTKSCPHRN